MFQKKFNIPKINCQYLMMIFFDFLVPRAKTCQEVEEMEMPPLQELSLRFTGSHLANASGLGQMLGAEPMSQSLRSVQLWFSNLPQLSRHKENFTF